MSTFAFKFTIFLYIPYRFLESIATFGYVKQFFRLLLRVFVCQRYNFTSSSSLIIAPLLTIISINLELGESVEVAVELLIDVI